MKIVKSNGRLSIHGDDISVYDTIPVGTYRIVDTMQGTLLERVDDLNAPEVIYGDVGMKVDRIMRSFENAGRSVGVILSGPQGLGKTLAAREMSQRLRVEHGIPTIIVDHDFDGLSAFLSSIACECMVLFDEFEKVFPSHETLLGYFDGTCQNRHLNVITVNSTDGLRFMVNRPGRFRWHIRFDYPSDEGIDRYLSDHDVAADDRRMIERIHHQVRLNYDMLDALVEEVTVNGNRVSDIINDMNILPVGNTNVIIRYVMDVDGSIVSGESEDTVYPDCSTSVYVDVPGRHDDVELVFPKGVPKDGSDIPVNLIGGDFTDGVYSNPDDCDEVSIRLLKVSIVRSTRRNLLDIGAE